MRERECREREETEKVLNFETLVLSFSERERGGRMTEGRRLITDGGENRKSRFEIRKK